MKTFKNCGLALAIAAALVMTTASCSSENDLVETPNVEQPAQPTAKGTTVHVTVGAGIGDDAATRSEVVTENGRRTLRFTKSQGTQGQEGYVPADRLFVCGRQGSGNDTKYLAGYLDMNETTLTADGKSAAFSGDLTVYNNSGNAIEHSFSTADPLSEFSNIHADLVAGGFKDGFIEIKNNYSSGYKYQYGLATGDDCVNTLMTTGMSVVSTTYTTADGFTDFQGDAILNCTISGLPKNEEYEVKLLCTADEDDYNNHKEDWDDDDAKKYDSRVSTSAEGVATFAISTEKVGDNYISVMLSLGQYREQFYLPLGKVTLAKNKVYNVRRWWMVLGIAEMATLTPMITPDIATNKSLTWTSSNEDVAEVSSEGVVTGFDAGTATITATTTDGGYTAKCVVTVTAPEYVDLDLSSGRKWATYNVGAHTPEGRGNYYAWGETEPKSAYWQSNYKYYRNPRPDEDSIHWELGPNGRPNLEILKYNTKGAFSFPPYDEGPDGQTVLDHDCDVDDVAMAHWGDDWRMPTKDDWRDLINETTHERVIENGVYVGLRLVGPNGNSIYLPTAGCYRGNEIYRDFNDKSSSDTDWPTCQYWSNEIDEERPYDAYVLFFNDIACSVLSQYCHHVVVDGYPAYDYYDFLRHEGRPVRAVYVGDASARRMNARRRK